MKATQISIQELLKQKKNFAWGIYIISHEDGRVEYVGKTVRGIKQRIKEHLRQGKSFYGLQIEIREYEQSEFGIGNQLEDIERKLILELQPSLNRYDNFVCRRCFKKMNALSTDQDGNMVCGKCLRIENIKKERNFLDRFLGR